MVGAAAGAKSAAGAAAGASATAGVGTTAGVGAVVAVGAGAAATAGGTAGAATGATFAAVFVAAFGAVAGAAAAAVDAGRLAATGDAGATLGPGRQRRGRILQNGWGRRLVLAQRGLYQCMKADGADGIHRQAAADDRQDG